MLYVACPGALQKRTQLQLRIRLAKRWQHHSVMFTKGTGQVDSLSLLVDGIDLYYI